MIRVAGEDAGVLGRRQFLTNQSDQRCLWYSVKVVDPQIELSEWQKTRVLLGVFCQDLELSTPSLVDQNVRSCGSCGSCGETNGGWGLHQVGDLTTLTKIKSPGC